MRGRQTKINRGIFKVKEAQPLLKGKIQTIKEIIEENKII